MRGVIPAVLVCVEVVLSRAEAPSTGDPYIETKIHDMAGIQKQGIMQYNYSSVLVASIVLALEFGILFLAVFFSAAGDLWC